MKKIVLILCLFTAIFTSCNKEKKEEKRSYPEIAGTVWKSHSYTDQSGKILTLTFTFKSTNTLDFQMDTSNESITLINNYYTYYKDSGKVNFTIPSNVDWRIKTAEGTLTKSEAEQAINEALRTGNTSMYLALSQAKTQIEQIIRSFGDKGEIQIENENNAIFDGIGLKRI